MTLCETVTSFGAKITTNYRETRYCDFAPPDETIGVIDVSPAGDGTRGVAFLADRMVVRLDGSTSQISYRDIRVMEIIPSYETPFEDELVIGSPAGSIRISDCSMNKFFLRQLISNVSRICNTMKPDDREALEQKLAADALEHYAGQLFAPAAEAPEEPVEALAAPAKVRVEAAAAVPEISRAKKAALAEKSAAIGVLDIPEEKIEWLSAPHIRREDSRADKPADTPEISPEKREERMEDLSDMSREETMSYLMDTIAEINSPAPEMPAAETAAPPQAIAARQPETAKIPQPAPAVPVPQLTREPDSPDIYIQASRKIRELIEEGRLTMAQVDKAVREQLVAASEVYSSLDVSGAPLPEAVKKRAIQLNAAADRLPEYFTLGEDVAARVMFFMLYQMLSYTDRILQTDQSKQQLNYFFVRFGAAGMVLSMLDANN